jgi:hypothetical protein
MTKQEYAIIKKFIQRVKKDLRLDMGAARHDKGSTRALFEGRILFVKEYMDAYEQIIKDDLKHSL